MISISLTNIGFNSGIMGKTIIAKLMSYTSELKQYDKIFLNINLFIFSFFLLVLVSKNKTGVFIVTYKLISESEWRKLRYQETTQELRKRVEESTSGKVGYLHISAMGSSDQAKFEREAYEYIQGKNAMIFDVRFNNGGNISDSLID